MGSRHGCATRRGITTVTGIVAGARISARRGDIRLCAVATIPGDRTATAEAGNCIGAGIQRSNCIGSLMNCWRLGHRGTRGARVARSYYHLDTSSFLSFDSGLYFVADCAPFPDGATPRVNRDVGRFGRVTFGRCAPNRIRGQEELHALDVCGWRAITLVHVTASDPLCTGRHADLVGPAIVPDRCARSVRTMKEIIARFWRVRPTNATAGMNRVVPTKIVIRVGSVPASVMRLKGVMRPANACVCTANYDRFAVKSERPHIRRVGVTNAWLDRRGRAR